MELGIGNLFFPYICYCSVPMNSKPAFFFLFDKMFMSNLKVLTRCSYGMVSMYHINAL